MFEQLSDRLRETVKRVRSQGRITEQNVKDTLREVRIALLEADVALPVVKIFIQQVQDRAVGQEVMGSLTPGQAVIKIVNEELISVMGQSSVGIDLKTRPPAVILVAGLQGAGKTTTVVKLSHWLAGHGKKRVLLSVVLRSTESTLTGEQAEETSQHIVEHCGKKNGAKLLD